MPMNATPTRFMADWRAQDTELRDRILAARERPEPGRRRPATTAARLRGTVRRAGVGRAARAN